MKTQVLITIVALIAGVVSRPAAAQTSDTYPILRTLDGHAYTNAEVSSATASYLIVLYDGGGSKIPLTNLPPELQRKYHFDPVAAAAAETAEEEKQAKARARLAEAQQAQQRLESWTGITLKARIVKSLPGGQYQIVDNPPTGLAWIPSRLPQHVVTIQKLPYEIASFVAKITGLREQVAPIGSMSANSPAGRGRGAQEAAGSAILGAQNAAIVRTQLQEMLPLEENMTTILVAPTRMQFGGVPTWRYMGRPVPGASQP
jgi:hypothetical protein